MNLEALASADRARRLDPSLREAWFNATDPASSKKAADAVQARAFEFVPFITTAQFILPTAYRSNISGVIIAPIAFLWNVEKK